MSFWTAVVVLFAIACITWLRHQKYQKLGSSNPFHGTRGQISSREQELEDQVEQLRERIKVLERIATDEQRGKDLAREIDALRDQ